MSVFSFNWIVGGCATVEVVKAMWVWDGCGLGVWGYRHQPATVELRKLLHEEGCIDTKTDAGGVDDSYEELRSISYSYSASDSFEFVQGKKCRAKTQVDTDGRAWQSIFV